MCQTAGEAIFTEDFLTPENTLFCSFVVATKVGATIELIDPSEALNSPGVVAFYSAKDIPGINSFVSTDFNYELEQLFIEDKVLYHDQPLGIIVANTKTNALRASKRVKVTYSIEKENNLVISISDALRRKDCADRIHLQKKSSVEELINNKKADIKRTGTFEMDSQYHFTLESQTCIAIPFENGLKIFSTTQWIDHTQTAISRLLNVPAADIQLSVRRVGGAFGCKITRCNLVACAAALAAFKLKIPTRFVQSIESMMRVNGKRWPCRSEYEFSVEQTGRILYISNRYYENAGCNLNENPVNLSTKEILKNCYSLSSQIYNTEGYAVITDTASNTWCRAPGSIEGICLQTTFP